MIRMIDPMTIYTLVSVGLLATSEVLSLIPSIQANGFVHAFMIIAKVIARKRKDTDDTVQDMEDVLTERTVHI